VNGKLAYRSGEAEPNRNGRFLARDVMSEASSGR
jgi:hypothetical protein